MQVNSSQRKARCKWETIVGGWPVQFRLPREGCFARRGSLELGVDSSGPSELLGWLLNMESSASIGPAWILSYRTACEELREGREPSLASSGCSSPRREALPTRPMRLCFDSPSPLWSDAALIA